MGVATRFRQEQVTCTLAADLEAMFHHVRVSPDNYDALRFLWWLNNDLEQEPVDYCGEVHLSGATLCPACFNFALRGGAEDNKSLVNLMKKKNLTVKNFYADDCLKSIESSARL